MGTPEVLGPYVIYERLGAGGMATVHRAEQIGLAGFRKAIALKRLLPHVAEDPRMVKMFTHEARLASHLRHANVVQIYDLGKFDQTYFIAMEFVPGAALHQIMKHCTQTIGPMPVAMVLNILGQICDALDHAHNLTNETGEPLGIIHRDVSPANVIVSNTGVAKLIDFGIAKAATGELKTQTGFVKGKYAYIAPEYTAGHLDLRADLFGLGVIAHEMLTARPLFHTDNDFETIVRLREMVIQPPSTWNPKITPDVDDIVMTALQRDPELRWQSASAMRTAVHNAARTSDNIATNVQLAEWVGRTFAKKPNRPAARGGELALDDEDDDDPDAVIATSHRISLEPARRATRTSAHVIQRGAKPDSSPPPPTRASHASQADTPVVESRALPLGGPVPTSLPLGGPLSSSAQTVAALPMPASPMPAATVGPNDATVAAALSYERAKRPSAAPANAIALVLPPEQVVEAEAAQREAERAQLAKQRFPTSEDSGVVVTAADPSKVVPTDKVVTDEPRRWWPWLVLALVVIAAGVAWYLYFIEGFVLDLAS